ncbi:MAG: Gfo/Idh/MocA family oxidoreductase [Bryobacteraceae bacterium]|jgi:predicted dehydrogenase
MTPSFEDDTNKSTTGISRRSFVHQASLAAGVGFPTIVASSAVGANPPSDRINLAAFGVGLRGTEVNGNFARFPDARFVAVCDAYGSRRQRAKRAWDAIYGGDYVKMYSNPFEVLDRSDVDAVVVTTSDHWHVPMAIAAARAKKDMYVEKPLSLAMAWSLRLRQEVKKSGRVFQYGTMQRSGTRQEPVSSFRTVCELVRNGYIGKIRRVEVWSHDISQQFDEFACKRWGSLRTAKAPDDLDMDFWCGPTEVKPYTADRCTQYGTYHCSDTGLGFIGGWGAHPLDIMQWGLDADDTAPVYFEGGGTVPKFGLFRTVDTWDIALYYANGIPVRFFSETGCRDIIMKYRKRYHGHGTTFFGTEGWISVDRSGVEASKPSLLTAKLGPNDKPLYDSPDHQHNFIDCIRSRKPTICPLESAIRSDTITHMTNIVVRTGRPVEYDPVKEQIVGGDAETARYWDRPMRKKWAV